MEATIQRMSDQENRIKDLFGQVQIAQMSSDGRFGLLVLLAALFRIFGTTVMMAHALAAILRIQVRSAAAA